MKYRLRAYGAQAALRLRQAALRSAFRRQTIQQRQHRAGRTRAEIRSKHGVESQCALECGGLEMFLEQVVDIHAADPQQLAHVMPSQHAYLQSQPKKRRAIAPIRRSQAWGHLG